MAKGNHGVAVYAPQGSGKSHIIAEMAFRAAEKGNRTLVVTHRQEVFQQNFAKMDSLGLSVQQITPRTKHITDSNVYCAMAQTLRARCDKYEYVRTWMQTIDFVIIDEGHRLDSQYLLQFFRKNVWIVGMSATWMRSGTQPQLGDTYQDIVATVSTRELIELGYLTPSENYAFQAPILTGVDIERGTGDYHQAQLQKRFAKPERYAGIIDNYLRICSGKKAAVYTVGAEHCISLCKAFCDAGLKAKYLLSGSFPETDGEYSGERKTLLQDFEDGNFSTLVSVGTVDVG
jgi:superfamily II DNA or RNA helicase